VRRGCGGAGLVGCGRGGAGLVGDGRGGEATSSSSFSTDCEYVWPRASRSAKREVALRARFVDVTRAGAVSRFPEFRVSRRLFGMSATASRGGVSAAGAEAASSSDGSSKRSSSSAASGGGGCGALVGVSSLFSVAI
jgi:hypothetical protein